MEPYYQDADIALHLGSVLDVLPTLPDASIDAVVCDPPYNLSSGIKRDTDCLRRILAKVQLPDLDDGNTLRSQGGNLAAPPLGGAELSREGRAVRVGPRVGVPEGAVDLQDAPVGEEEVNTGHKATLRAPNGSLPLVPDAESVEHFGNYVLKLADGGNAPFCDGTCSCFTEPGPGRIAVTVALPGAPGSDLLGTLLGGERGSDEHVRLLNDAGRQAEAAATVVAGTRAVVHAVLCLDLGRRTGELRLADGAHHGDPIFALVAAQSVGAGAGASGLSSVSEPGLVRCVDGQADGAFTLKFPWHDVNSSRQGRGFMGKEWDGWESPAAYQRWCVAWARECWRVLKPGGHLIAFGAPRTYHRLAVAIEDAGFEIRDSLHWIYGSGFPKSHDVSKAIDKAKGAQRERVGSQPDRWTGRGAVMNFATDRPQTDIPVLGGPATEDAAIWSGWGTALKPAHEPIVLARKPLAGPVAATVLEFGTGALNVDACRIEADEDYREKCASVVGLASNRNGATLGEWAGVREDSAHPAGRWPTNIILGHGENCVDGGACEPGCPVAEMDAQSGVRTSGSNCVRRKAGSFMEHGGLGKAGDVQTTYGDSGGASRYFPTFRYEAKAPKSERPRLADGTVHTTVKPLALMRWLVRLVTPPNGTVLDPFAGSGTTLEAAVTEGFHAIGVELLPEHADLCVQRLSKPITPVLFGESA